MRWLAPRLLVICLAGPSLACDYPGPPLDSVDARAASGDITWAGYSDATQRYGHGILGDTWEAGGLRVHAGTKGPCDLSVILPEHSVFEDISPRITDLDGDGRNEVIVIESHNRTGAALAIYGLRDGVLRKITATPNIGRSHRWLAPIGAADLDGDGYIELAYIDRPHLAKTLRIWRYRDGALEPVADLAGFTNHRIGWPYIPGGIRDCGDTPEMIVASADWSRIIAARLVGGEITTRDIAPYRSSDDLNAATAC